jgi:transcriptional regulator with XRE-family HTH domain
MTRCTIWCVSTRVTTHSPPRASTPIGARRGHRARATRGYDAGKRVNGRKRQMIGDRSGPSGVIHRGEPGSVDGRVASTVRERPVVAAGRPALTATRDVITVAAPIAQFAEELSGLRGLRRLSLRALASQANYGKSYLHELETGRKRPTAAVARRLDEVLRGRGVLVAAAGVEDVQDADGVAESEAVELARRASASDMSRETLQWLEAAFDELAMAYATTPPAELLERVRRHLGYVGQLVEARKTLEQHRRLLKVGGWLALLKATVHVDLRQTAAAAAHLATAEDLAAQAEDPDIGAWCLETRAWEALTAGDYRRAVDLSQRAQVIAPVGGSAIIQATAQEGRAWARIGNRKATRAALDRVEAMASSLRTPERPEHHYRYDPAKALSYAATTLSWVGDPAAEPLAREVIHTLDANGEATRPRRIASAQLDLGLALLAAGKPDEASFVAMTALKSGRIVPSNWWRATEVLTGVERSEIPEASHLRDAYEAHRPSRRPVRAAAV